MEIVTKAREWFAITENDLGSFEAKDKATMNDVERRDRRSHLHPFTSMLGSRPAAPVIRQADGMTIVDQSGRSYLDAMSGAWCVNVGYGNREIVEAITAASARLSFAHTHRGFGHEAVAVLADRLVELAPGKMRKAFFGNSGSDANDTNLKLARMYHLANGDTGRIKFIVRDRAYHGLTLATASLSGLPGFHRSFGLPESSYVHVSAPDRSMAFKERSFGSEEDYADALAAELEATIIREDPSRIAAFVAEPVMAVGGVLMPPGGYFPKIKHVLDRYGILFLADDVVCSFGRLGHWFGSETLGIEPDLIAIAKGLTSGYVPMSASLVSDRVWRVLEHHAEEIGPLGHGFTTSGHPLAAAAALANINVLEKQGLLAAALSSGHVMLEALSHEFVDNRSVAGVRGTGLLIGIELAVDAVNRPQGYEPGALAANVASACLDLGLIVRACPERDIIALSPPLIISEIEIETVTDRLSRALGSVEGISG